MADWQVRLFGKPSVQFNGKPWSWPESSRAQQIFLFLLSRRLTAHSRESLACMLWGECTEDNSRKHLRQTLWRLRSCASQTAGKKRDLLVSVDKDHVQVNPAVECWVDTEIFERAYNQIKGRRELDEATLPGLREAVELYRGEFLEGYFQDWCVYERERFQNMYLAMLDKLIEWCLAHDSYEEGLDWGERALRLDPASERAHQQLMRLHHLSGNRTLALRQYERCVRALREDLGVEPSNATLQLLRRIRADRLSDTEEPRTGSALEPVGGGDSNGLECVPAPSLSEVIASLRQFPARMVELQREFERNITLAEQLLAGNVEQARAGR